MGGNQTMLALTAEEQIALEKQKLANKNPFGGLKRQNTDALLSGMLAVSDANDNIPDLEGWLMKQMPSGEWERRWVVVKGAHILWNDKKISIMDDRDAMERRQFRNDYNLLSLEKIGPAAGKEEGSERIFQFQIGTRVKERKTLVYRWKADSEKNRNYWVSGLSQRKELLSAFQNFLED